MKLYNIFICIFLLFINILSFSETSIPEIKYKKITINDLADINKWKNSDELYTFSNINIDLRELSTNTKKTTFIDILLPAIKVVNSEIRNNSKIAKNLSKKENLTPEEKKYAEFLFNKYRVEYGDWEKLDSQLIIYPTSLILTQGAIESGWGTSRFFRMGNNLFGMWSSDPNEPRMAAKQTRDNGFTPHLKKYDDIKESVEDFVLNLSRNNAYKNLRKLVNEDCPPHVIATGLINYSEEKDLYVKKVINTMKNNNFTEYDK